MLSIASMQPKACLQLQGHFYPQAIQYQPPPQYYQPQAHHNNVIPPPVHSQSLNPDPHGTGSGPQNQYQPQPHANSIPLPVQTQQALPMPQSYRMVQQGSHAHPQPQPQSPYGAQHQFQALPNLSSESLRAPSLQQPQGLTAAHCTALASSPRGHPVQASPTGAAPPQSKEQAHPPGASQIPRYDEAVLTKTAQSQDGDPMHQPYWPGPSQPQGPAGHLCQQPQAQHQVSEGTRHRSPSLDPIPLLYTRRSLLRGQMCCSLPVFPRAVFNTTINLIYSPTRSYKPLKHTKTSSCTPPPHTSPQPLTPLQEVTHSLTHS